LEADKLNGLVEFFTIQELPGRSRPETTMIYMHITQKDIKRIQSPLNNFAIGKILGLIETTKQSSYW
jgi:hypothetical protein